MAIHHSVNCAARRDLYRVRQTPQQTLADLARAPVGLFLLRRHNGGFDLIRQLVGIPERPASSVAQPFQTRLLIPRKDLVAGLP